MKTWDVDETLDARGKRYGRFLDQAHIAQGFKGVMWAAIESRGSLLAPDQTEALEMILHKIARIINGDPNYTDSWHDIAGYAKLIEDRLKGNSR